VRHKNVRVADVLNQTPLNIAFTRILREERWERWLHLVERLMQVQPNDDPDSFTWHLTTSGVSSAKYLYENYMNNDT
jgi:hypothetical protein